MGKTRTKHFPNGKAEKRSIDRIEIGLPHLRCAKPLGEPSHARTHACETSLFVDHYADYIRSNSTGNRFLLYGDAQMAATRRDSRIPQEKDILLSELIAQEMGSMVVYKEAYDLDYPQHRKTIAPAELWHIARRKVIEELAAPLSEEPHSLQP